mgnify:CR=1 FL=1
MPELEIKNIEGKVTGTLSLPEETFGLKGGGVLMHGSVVNYLANQRQGTHATKTKGLVSGGGKKPWKQKHTGRARAGSSRSPIWRGGGTTFGPQPRDYSYEMPRKEKKRALYTAISHKIADGGVTVVDALKVDGPKTKKMVEMLKVLGLSGAGLLVVDAGVERDVVLSGRNIPGLKFRAAKDLNAYDVLAASKLLVTRTAMEALKVREAQKG